jgi:twitching motility protein PilT
MLHGRDRVSDLIFSPGRAPQVEERGELIELPFEGIEQLTPAQTIQIAEDLIGANQIATQQLTKSGSADLSYALTGVARFRVNIFRQRSSCAIVMRVIPSSVPSFDDLRLPPVLQEIVPLRNGIVLVTGPTGSGKSSTLAAVVDRMNETRAIHILTIEDPIEFMHRTRRRRSTSANCTATRRRSAWRFAPRCVRRRRSSSSARCATARRSRSRSRPRRPATS